MKHKATIYIGMVFEDTLLLFYYFFQNPYYLSVKLPKDQKS